MLRRLGPGASVLLYIFLLFQATGGAPSNRTIDDTNGDGVTGVRPIYLPDGPWGDASCGGCAIQPDRSKAFHGTWTAATFHPDLKNISINFGFRGTAVYVFLIIANTEATGVTTLTECDFFLDGAHLSSYQHTPTTSTAIDYNVSAFSTANLVNTDHNVSIVTADKSYSTFLNFDYAIYTFDDQVTIPPSSRPMPQPPPSSSELPPLSQGSPPSSKLAPLSQGSPSSSKLAPSSQGSPSLSNPAQSFVSSPENPSNGSPPAGVIIGGAVGGIVALGILAAVLIIWYRRSSDNRPQGDTEIRGHAPALQVGSSSSSPSFGRRDNILISHNHPQEPTLENRTNGTNSIGSSLGDVSLEVQGPLSDSRPWDSQSQFRKSLRIWQRFIPAPSTYASFTSARRVVPPYLPAALPRARAHLESQLELDQLISQAQREIRDLKSEVGHRVPATFAAQPRSAAEVLNAMAEQIQAMRQQIATLEAQRSPGTHTFPDAPPDYVA